MSEKHITDHDLERYYLGMVTQEEELAPLEEHLLWCHSCVHRAEETQEYVDIIRRAIILGNYDLDGGPPIFWTAGRQTSLETGQGGLHSPMALKKSGFKKRPEDTSAKTVC